MNNIREYIENHHIKSSIFFLLIICIIVFATYWPSLSANALSFDDEQYLVENVLVKKPSLQSAKRFLTEVFEPSTVGGYYQPLAMISLMLDYKLGGRPNYLLPFHRTSLILHLANTMLIIMLLYILFGNFWVAATVGLIFGIHPLTVEPISWVGERKTLLAAFFAFFCLIFYIFYTRNKRWYFYVGCMISYILALMSKPTITLLPFLMLILDYWPLQRLKRQVFLEKIPFFIIGVISSLVTYISQSRTGGLTLPNQYGPECIPLIFCHNIIFYLYKMIWPAYLSSHYAFPKPLVASNPAVMTGIIGTFILIFLLLISLRWTRSIIIGWLFFFVALLPTMQILRFSNVIASDKFAYFSSFGILMILMFSLSKLFSLISERKLLYSSIIMIILMIISAEVSTTRKYLNQWKNTETLYKHMLERAPNAAPLHSMLGYIYCQEKRIDEALYHLKRSLECDPNDSIIRTNYGNILCNQGKLEDAISQYQYALNINPNNYQAYNNLGNTMLDMGKIEDAISYYHKSLNIKPDFPDAYFNLGYAMSEMNKLNEAISYYKQALSLKPDYSDAYNNLGSIFNELNKFDEAIDCYNMAIHFEANRADLFDNCGIILVKKGNLNEAIKQFNQALQIEPNYTDAYYHLSNILINQNRWDEVLKISKVFLKHQPNSYLAFYNLGLVSESQKELEEAVKYYLEALNIEPSEIRAHVNLGNIYLTQGLIEKAFEYYNHALKVNPKFAPAYYNLGLALESCNKLEEAIIQFKFAVLFRSETPVFQFKLGSMLKKTGKNSEAIQYFCKAGQLDSKYLPYLNDISWSMANGSDPNVVDPNSVIILAECVAELTQYKNATVLDTLATAYASAGNYDQAIKTSQMAIKIALISQDEELANSIKKRLELFKNGKPYNELINN